MAVDARGGRDRFVFIGVHFIRGRKRSWLLNMSGVQGCRIYLILIRQIFCQGVHGIVRDGTAKRVFHFLDDLCPLSL